MIALLLLISPSAYAQDATQIADFISGRYEAAINGSTLKPTPDLLAFQARAVLAHGMCGNTQPSQELLQQAEQYAREALALDQDHVEAQLQLAITLSLKARPLTNRAALKTGYGDEAKSLAEHALITDPNNAYANGFMAVWHIEVVRRGGAIGSRLMGASVKKARKFYQKAIAASPDDASIHWQYARALAALNAKKYKKEIQQTLSEALASPAESHVERVMSERARELQQRLHDEPVKSVEAWAEQAL